MRRRFTGIIAAGAALAMTFSGTAFAMDAAELSQKSAEALKTVQQYTMDFDGKADLSLHMVQEGENGATMDMPVAGNVKGNVAFSIEPLAAAANITFDGSAMGQGGSGAVEMYLASQDDGSAVAYVKPSMNGEEGVWQASKVDTDKVAQVKDAFTTLRDGGSDAFLEKFTSQDSDLDAEQMKALVSQITEQLNSATTVGADPVDNGGRQCYEVSADLSGDMLAHIFTDVLAGAQGAGATVDESSLAVAEEVMSMLNVGIRQYYDAESFLPVSGKIDLSGSDFASLGSMFGSMTGAEDAQFGLSCNALEVNYNVDFNAPVEVNVPEEALAAPVEEGDLSLDGIESAVEGETEGEEGNAYTEEGVVNEDGSYHLEDSDYEGSKIAADVTVPEGMEANFATESSVYFIDESLKNTVSYATVTYADAEELLKQELDTSYMESKEEYSEINTSEVGEITLENGNTVKYASVSYKYQDYRSSRMYAVIPVGNMSLEIQIEKMDENYDPVEVTEEDIIRYAEAVSIAG